MNFYYLKSNFKPSYESYNIPIKEINDNENINKKMIITKAKQKVIDDEMEIPCKDTFYLFEKYNYSLPQLKKIIKHYNLKMSGTKKDILRRIQNYILVQKYILFIQRFTRGYIQRTYNKLHGPAYKDRSLCTNDTDFYTLEPLKEIPLHNFYSFEDNGFIYGFELSSIYNLFKENNYFDVENPYTRKIMDNSIFKKIGRIVKLSKVLKLKINLCLERVLPQNNLESILKMRSLKLFQYINRLGNYSSDEWFLSLSNIKLIRFLRELEDIWDYRASITPQNKLRICSPNGNPFLGINVMNLRFIDDITKLKIVVLNIMENFVYSGRDDTYRNLGAMYVLGALTIVNERAAEALPWLYESFSVFDNDSD